MYDFLGSCYEAKKKKKDFQYKKKELFIIYNFIYNTQCNYVQCQNTEEKKRISNLLKTKKKKERKYREEEHEGKLYNLYISYSIHQSHCKLKSSYFII